MRIAKVYWRDFSIHTRNFGTASIADPPLLNLVKLRKMEPECFVVGLYWMDTNPGEAPLWPRRTFLAETTGFDFSTAAGCSAARRFAAQELGHDKFKNIDDAVFRGEFNTDLAQLNSDLRHLWTVWCRHGTDLLQ